MLTYFVVQSFSRGRKGAVVADLPLQMQTGEQAIRRAERLAKGRVGALAFSRLADPDTGDYAEAVVLGKFGDIPEIEEQLRLAS
ncbi:MAG TPA: hypothetical protein VGN98_06575 [Tianweitania sediminis]|jgi:hypothetical protein|nr:hypothetical protein [Tianweitania sediminis]